MTGKTSYGSSGTKTKEARDLVREGVEAVRHGGRDEGQFLTDAAKDLDPEAATKALKGQPAEEVKR